VSASQRPTATRVAGFGTWKELGRFVKRGEKGIQILAPMTGYRRRKSDAEQETDEKPKPVLFGFRVVHVFDVAQTEGADLPEYEFAISGEVDEYRDRLLYFLERQGIELVFAENIAPALGVSYGGRIALLPGQSQAQEFVTLVHEIAHELLHKADRRTFTTPTVRETEAEAVAFVVGQAIGLEMGNASSDYIQMYNGNPAVLAESLEIIQRTSAVILAALQPPANDGATESEPASNALAEVA
jgi:antirestriction protein ArdC